VPPNATRRSRTRKTESAADRKARRSGSTGSGQRQVQRTKKDMCWQESYTARALHGNISSHPLEQSHQSVLSFLIGKIKPKKLAITACMRKFLTILNSMMKNNQTWNQNRITFRHSRCPLLLHLNLFCLTP